MAKDFRIIESVFLSTSVCLLIVFLVLLPKIAFAYGQASYYSQGYYQGYYQAYYQGYYQSYYQGSYNLTIAGGNSTITGDLTVSGSIGKGSGTFVIDHPLDPANKLLYHSFVESPDVKNIYDGVVTLNAFGEATITLPKYFEALNKDFRYQYSAYGTPAPDLYIKSEIKNHRFTIAGGPAGARVSWQVTGIRHDPYILEHPIVVEVEKGPDALANKGEYLFAGYADTVKATQSGVKAKLSALWNWFIGLFSGR